MTLKSIERHLANHSVPYSYPWVSDMIADVEAEIAERFMELPVDAEGVPIHVGENILWADEGPFEVCGVNNDSVWFDGSDKEWVAAWANVCHHYKPRTLEDVLCDMIHEYACTDMTTEQTAAKYAAELRDLLGGDGR